MIGITITVLIILLSGLGWKWYGDNDRDLRTEITWVEFVIGAFVALIVLTPVTFKLFGYLSIKNQVTFEETWHGYEKAVAVKPIACTRDGICAHHYSCDPYTVCTTVCSGSGKTTSCHQVCTVHYHQCPYVNTEYTYQVVTSLGNYSVARNRFPENPNQHRWRSGHSISNTVISQAGIGPTQFWLDAKARIELGTPASVSVTHSYENYILASEQSVFKQYEGNIEQYKDILPDIPHEIYNFYATDRILLVGSIPISRKNWNDAVMHFNTAFGPLNNGDLYLVITNKNVDPDIYTGTLSAYWGSRKYFGVNAIPKNAVVVVLGTNDSKTVSWARAFTGMPIGNDELIIKIRNSLTGTPLEISSLLHGYGFTINNNVFSKGTPTTELENILIKTFKRVSMSGDEKSPGFLYLKGEVKPTVTSTIIASIILVVLAQIIWLIMLYGLEIAQKKSYSFYRR